MRRDDRAIPTALPLAVTLLPVVAGCTRKAPRQTVSPLQQAAKTNDLQRVQLLGASGAHVNGHDQNAWTPPHSTAFQGHSDLVVILLENGARTRPLSEPNDAL
jgi:ankyrin repeat protein